MKSDSGTWSAVGRGAARRLGEGPDEERREHQREAVAALVARPQPRRLAPVAAVALAAGLAAALVAGWWILGRDAPMAFWVGEARVAGTEGTWIDVPEGGNETLRFEDGSRIDVQGGSLVRIAQVRDERVRVVLDHGFVVASVNPERHARWSIDAGPYSVSVTGTQFDVSWDPQRNGIGVVVKRGVVQVTGPGLDGKGTTLGQGDTLHMASGAPVAEPVKVAGAPPAAEAASASEQHEQADDEQAPPPDDPEPRTQNEPLWKKLSADGRYEEAVAEAQKLGFTKLTRTLGKSDLWDLASAARFAREGDLAVEALEAYRDRFSGTSRASTAAFLIGRVQMEQNKSPAQAIGWFQTYLDEQPAGPLAEEAMGRLMDAQAKAGKSASAAKTAETYLSKHPQGIFKELAESLTSK